MPAQSIGEGATTFHPFVRSTIALLQADEVILFHQVGDAGAGDMIAESFKDMFDLHRTVGLAAFVEGILDERDDLIVFELYLVLLRFVVASIMDGRFGNIQNATDGFERK